MRTDFQNIKDGTKVTIYPNEENPIHSQPVEATFLGGYFYCRGSNPYEGPDYYLGDVFRYNNGFEPIA